MSTVLNSPFTPTLSTTLFHGERAWEMPNFAFFAPLKTLPEPNIFFQPTLVAKSI
jgi:hypothetical protein